MYSIYINNFSTSIECLEQVYNSNSKFKIFLKEFLKNNSLNSLLITPIQRIPRVKIIIKKKSIPCY
jgi:hypothetical protein